MLVIIHSLLDMLRLRISKELAASINSCNTLTNVLIQLDPAWYKRYVNSVQRLSSI